MSEELFAKVAFTLVIFTAAIAIAVIVSGCTPQLELDALEQEVAARRAWNTRTVPAQCEINRAKITNGGPEWTKGVSYRNITPAEMLACGWEPMPNDVCLSHEDCVAKAAKK